MKQEKQSHSQSLEVMATLALACVIIGFFLDGNRYLFALGALMLLIGLFAKPLANTISKLWGMLGHVLGTINTKIILSTIFFIVLTPLAFANRLFKGDIIGLKQKSGNDRSYWHRRDHTFGASDLEKPW